MSFYVRQGSELCRFLVTLPYCIVKPEINVEVKIDIHCVGVSMQYRIFIRQVRGRLANKCSLQYPIASSTSAILPGAGFWFVLTLFIRDKYTNASYTEPFKHKYERETFSEV